MLVNATDLDQQTFAQIAGLIDDWLSFKGADSLRKEFAYARYEFKLTRAESGYGGGALGVRVDAIPKGRGHRSVNDSGHVTVTRPRPEGALPGYYLDAVATDPDLVYRGMAWEEWAFIRRTGNVQSFGGYNIGQQGLTFWGTDFGTAAYYANGFAPWPFKPGLDHPGIVIAIPKQLTIGPKDHPEVPDAERATVGPLAAHHLASAWALIVTEIRGFRIEGVAFLRTARPRLEDEYVRGGPDITVVVVPNRG